MKNYNLAAGSAIVNVDPSVYSKEVVLGASYAMLGKAHLMVGKDKKTGEFLVKLNPLEGKSTSKILEELAKEFNDQLINYALDSTGKCNT